MKIAIMQPYFFPYLGYFQLIHSVDKFVFYDDVNFMKKGWVNRNNILLKGKAHLFSLPLRKASQNRKINEIEVSSISEWAKKFLQSLELNYKKAPYFYEVFSLVSDVLRPEVTTVSEAAMLSVEKVSDYLGLEREFIVASQSHGNRKKGRLDSLIDICQSERANEYVNAPGGRTLYEAQDFNAFNIGLYFLEPVISEYRQFEDPFVPALSIIDVLMFNSVAETNKMIANYSIESAG